VFTGHVTAGIAIVHVPDVTGDMLLQNHDMARSYRRHARRRSSPWKTPPIGREIQFWNDPAKTE
jgi:hypothetical protein